MIYQNKTKQSNSISLSAVALAILLSSHSYAAPTCTQPDSDHDNDGWGWEDNQSCVVDTQSAITPITATGAVPTIATPLCSSASIDSDNDGWGWENNQSCIVATTQTTLATNPNTTAVTSAVISDDNTQCSSAASDHDNDGWGWENNQSCKVITSSDPALQSVPVTPAATEKPICENASSDHDNDGWGWENNASCIAPNTSQAEPEATTPTPVTTTVAAAKCSILISDDNDDGWGWENNQSCKVSALTQPLKIMAVGDSITHGVKGQTSYREPLTTLLTQSGCQYDFVGSQNSNAHQDGFIAAHESYSGHTADHFLTGRYDSAGNNQGIANSMDVFNPDVVMLHIGSNDMRLGQNVDNTLAEIDQIISTIQQKNSGAIVFVANLVPWYQQNVQSAVATLGDKIETYVAQMSNPAVRLVDVRSGYTSEMMIFDQIHPNATGDAHIADAFFNAYDTAGLCKK